MYLCLEQPEPTDHGLLGLAHLLLLPPRHRLLRVTQLQPQLCHGRLLRPGRSTAVASATVGRRQGVASASQLYGTQGTRALLPDLKGRP
jgi:hypothetical protein